MTFSSSQMLGLFASFVCVFPLVTAFSSPAFTSMMPSLCGSSSLARRPTCRVAVPQMQVGWSGGDLEGGTDDARNADIRALKKLFYTDGNAAAESADSGLLRDIPIARFRMVLLPHQQVAFNIFQPQLVHMFETLLSTPKPWLYMHAQLPGGVENLGNPEYAMPGLGDDGAAGRKATLQGTLMEVVAAERQPDSRLALACQALTRAVVLKGTQALPYSRCDVQMLPDAEQVRCSGASLKMAVAEEHCWRPYEFAPLNLDADPTQHYWPAGNRDLPPSASFDPKAIAGCVRRAAELVPDGDTGDDEEEGCEAVVAVVAAARRGMEEEEAEEESRLALLEVQVWLELDAFLRVLASKNGGGLAVPSTQLLSLLPPPPAAGWPHEFSMQKAADKLQQASTAESVAVDLEPLVGCSELYPSRRRAQRLSFVLWVSISQDDTDLQAALEAVSTSDRLRLGCVRLRELRELVQRS